MNCQSAHNVTCDCDLSSQTSVCSTQTASYPQPTGFTQYPPQSGGQLRSGCVIQRKGDNQTICIGHLESKERLRIQPTQLFHFS